MTPKLVSVLVVSAFLVGGTAGFGVSHWMDSAKLALPSCAQVASAMSAQDAAKVNAGISTANNLFISPFGQDSYDGIRCRN